MDFIFEIWRPYLKKSDPPSLSLPPDVIGGGSEQVFLSFFEWHLFGLHLIQENMQSKTIMIIKRRMVANFTPCPPELCTKEGKVVEVKFTEVSFMANSIHKIIIIREDPGLEAKHK